MENIFLQFLDDEYQSEEFKLQQKTPYRERNPKQQDIISMVSVANKIFLK
jgi:hypothetical protein